MVKYKESESESEGASHAPEPCFRVRVSMAQFYSAGDVRARAYVCVSPRRRVRWLARRLRRLFALPRLRLLSRGHLLPPQEPLSLLQPDDPVECVPNVGPPQSCGKEPEDTADVRDVVDFVDEMQVATVEELQRSPSPVYPDDLTETKRQALMMLEEICTEPAAERAADRTTRPRRRRVRRRRRVPPADTPSLQSGGSAGTDADEEPAPADVTRGLRPLAPADVTRRPGALAPADVTRGPGPLALVLRNDLQPRAPRVVRPLSEPMTASLLDPPPTENAPNAESALNADAAALLRDRYDDYFARAKLLTDIHARAPAAAPAPHRRREGGDSGPQAKRERRAGPGGGPGQATRRVLKRL